MPQLPWGIIWKAFFYLPQHRGSRKLVASIEAGSHGLGGACCAGSLEKSQVRHLFRSQVTEWPKVTGGKQKGI